MTSDVNLDNFGAFLSLSPGYLYKEHAFRKLSVSARFINLNFDRFDFNFSEFEPWVSLQGAGLQKVIRFRAFVSQLNSNSFDINFDNSGAFMNLSAGYLYKEHGFRKCYVSARFRHVSFRTEGVLISMIFKRL